jgi:DNA-binding response OmpR family regulator
VPIIVVTGLASEFTRLAGFESGATDYVTKPFMPSELVSKIDGMLRLPEKELVLATAAK